VWPDAQIKTRPEYDRATSRIDVIITVNGQMKTVWSNNRNETNSHHKNIIEAIRVILDEKN
jgi:hypothetical protein